MRYVIVLVLVMVAGLALAGPTTHGQAGQSGGSGAALPDPPRDVKWSQLPLYGGAGVSSQYAANYPFYSESADDFFWDDGTPVVMVEWWGQYWGGDPVPPDFFMIRFYSDEPGPPYSHPDSLLYVDYCYDYNEEWDPVYEQYHYRQILGIPFSPEPGNVYWLSVQSVLDYPPQWGWSECDPAYYWNDEAVMDFALLVVPRWTPLSDPGALGLYGELSFVLHSEPTSVQMLREEAASWSRIKGMFR